MTSVNLTVCALIALFQQFNDIVPENSQAL